jgi:hypothetical protein
MANIAHLLLRSVGAFAPESRGALKRLFEISAEAVITIEQTAVWKAAHVAQIAKRRLRFPVLMPVKPADQKQTLAFLKGINQGEHAELATKPTTRYDATDELGKTAWRLYHFVKLLRFSQGPYA